VSSQQETSLSIPEFPQHGDIMEESSFYRSIVAEGAAKAKREIAINLLQAGLTVTLISSSTGLSIERVI
jgi:hypothetical protein